jgi:pimeloyl-ACP methyl ester carboxylesterase
MNLIAQTERGPIEYRAAGRGPAVLVLNGGHTDCRSPLGHERFFLERGYRLLVPSRPGYGGTPAALGRTAEAFADALAGFLDLLRVARAVVVGISGGGPTALQLAGRHPARVSKLILQSAVTGLRFPTGATRLGAYLLFNRWVERGVWGAFRAFASAAPRAALGAMLRGLSALPPRRVLAAMSPEQRRAALEFLLASRSGAGFLCDIRHRCGDLGRVAAPTLILHSRYDGAVAPAHAVFARDHLPRAELFLSPAESHLLWFSPHDEEIRAKMQAFLRS